MAPESFQLVMRTGPTPEKAFALNKSEITIGRESGNDIVINDAEVSRRHARLLLQPGGYMLEDLGSTNGTFANGQRLMGPHSLQPGELIYLGENISLSYETYTFDPDATVVGGGPVRPSVQVYKEPLRAEPPPPVSQYAPPPYREEPARSSVPAYGEPIPSGPAVYDEAPTGLKKARVNQSWILAGSGCLIMLCIGCMAFAFFLDAIGLLCVPPFRTITEFFLPIYNLIMGGQYTC